MSTARSGFALLEALVALTIVTTVGVSVVTLAQTAIRSEQSSAEEERATADAERILTAISLLRRAELDQRLGGHEVGEFTVTIERPQPALFRVSLARTAAPSRELLVIVLYRKSEAAG